MVSNVACRRLVGPGRKSLRTPALQRCGYALTVFLGAFLLFQVEPLISKRILPWFGGSPSVWTTCMLVFQLLLLAGYAYAHLVARISPRPQAILHMAVLIAALGLLPVVPNPLWKPTGEENPLLRIVLILLVSVGAPFFVLASTGPLLQSWSARTRAGRSPFRLYALSNAGSLLGLLTYPFLVEPNLTVRAQAWIWSGAFAAYALLCATIAVTSLWPDPCPAGPAERARGKEEAAAGSAPPGAATITLWFALGAVPSVMLLAVTNMICLDIASLPFLWVLPLSLYLISFILCFDGTRWYRRHVFAAALAASTVLVLAMLLRWWTAPIAAQVVTLLVALFSLAMFCHGELVRSKPHPRHLTLFYLVLAAAGAAGGALVSLAAPLLFVSFVEVHFALFAALLLALIIVYRDRGGLLARGRPRWAWAGMLMFVAVAGSGLGYHAFAASTRGNLFITRNFYGLLWVNEEHGDCPEQAARTFNHGNTMHGRQFTSPARRREPTAYYGETSGIGLVLRHHHAERPRRIGVVGLGAGTLAAYVNGGDSLRFYEIDPDVLRIARKYFTFLDDCRGPWEVVLGDARLSLEAELARREPQRFDVLAIDAFSSDSIPLHLLTEEAAAVYMAHLAPDGVLAFHISNRNLDLQPVLTALVRRYGLASRLVNVEPRRLSDWGSRWVLTSRQPPVLAGVEYGGCPPLDHAKESLWSDDYCSLAKAVKNWSFAPATAAHPRSSDAFDRGVAYLDKNDLDAAEVEFRKALAESDRDPFTWMRLGNTLRKKSELGEAARCYERAVRIDPNYADAYNNLAAVLASSDSPRALEYLRTAVRIAPRNVEARANLGSLLARQGNKDEAIRQYEIALALNPRLATVRQALAALKQFKTAIP